MTAKRILIIVSVLLVFAGGYVFWRWISFTCCAPPRIELKGDAENDVQKAAVEIATNHLKTLPRYKFWKEKGADYYVLSVQPHGSAKNFWEVQFEISTVTDQGISIIVDMDKKSVAEVFEHFE